jgi:tripartite-type tricarboxylate transporter receptor subunit TctC
MSPPRGASPSSPLPDRRRDRPVDFLLATMSQPPHSSGKSFTRRALGALAFACAAAAAVPALAQDYPNRPIRMVIPFGPGTGIDGIGRVFAQKLAAELGQPVVVENRAGASGIIGADYVAKAAPDGYTLFFSAGSIFALNPILFAKLPYDPVRSFTPISLVYSQPLVVATSLKVPAKTLPELVTLARAQPGKLSAGNVGGFQLLATQYFSNVTNTKFLNVPFKSGTTVALLAGEIDMMVDVISLLAPQGKAGKINVLAVASEKRMPIAPNVPTLAELGYPIEISTWTSLTGPANLPRSMVERLNAATRKIVAEPDFVERANAQGVHLAASAPEYLNDLVHAETTRWQKVADEAGLTPQ